MQLHTTILVLHQGSAPSVLSFSQPLIRIGRGPDFVDGEQRSANDIILSAPRISAKHAHIVVTDAGLTVVDHSVNGTFVNGEPLTAPRQLTPGDLIEIDAYTLRCEFAASEAPQPQHLATPYEPTPTLDLARNLVPSDDLPVLDIPLFSAQPPDAPAITPVPVARTLSPMPAVASPPIPAPPVVSHRPLAPMSRSIGPSDEHASVAAAPPTRDPLAQLYRSLAVQFAAPVWGRPPQLDDAALPRVTDAARRSAQTLTLPPGLWPEWLARELCGLGPLAALLDDATVTRLVVRGTAGIDVFRGAARETSASRFSCPEAIFAVLERWTGARPELPLDLALAPDLHIHAWGPPLTPNPLVVVTRTRTTAIRSLDDLVADRVLPRAAADLLRLALRHNRNILLHGGPGADLTTLLVALGGELSHTRTLAVLRRRASWPHDHAVILDGHSPSAWPCLHRLAADWMIVDELVLADLPHLVALARHHAGGTLATTRAPTAEASMQRLAAQLAAAHGAADLAACRQVIAACFDVVVGVRQQPNDRLQLDGIAEIRTRGELAALFAWNADTATIEPTTIEPQVLR